MLPTTHPLGKPETTIEPTPLHKKQSLPRFGRLKGSAKALDIWRLETKIEARSGVVFLLVGSGIQGSLCFFLEFPLRFGGCFFLFPPCFFV